MTTPTSPPPPTGNPDAPTLVLSREQLEVSREWIATGRLRLRREVISETTTVEVTVRREVLVLDGQGVSGEPGRLYGTQTGGPAVPAPPAVDPIVIVLREEVPEVTLRVQPYERVTARVERVDAIETVAVQARHEQATVDITEPAASRR